MAVEHRDLFMDLTQNVQVLNAKTYPQGRKNSLVLYDFLTLYRDSGKMHRRIPYDYLLSLSDTPSFNKTQHEADLSLLNKGLDPEYKPGKETELYK